MGRDARIKFNKLVSEIPVKGLNPLFKFAGARGGVHFINKRYVCACPLVALYINPD